MTRDTHPSHQLYPDGLVCKRCNACTDPYCCPEITDPCRMVPDRSEQ